VTAPRRRSSAGDARQAWRQADEIRSAWLAHGLSTEDADRAATEQSITNLYARLRRSRPEFRWVDSPLAAMAQVSGFPTHEDLVRWSQGRPPPGQPPLVSNLAAAVSRLRSTLEDDLTVPWFNPSAGKRDKGKPWPVLPPEEAIEMGIPFSVILRQSVRDVTWTRLAAGLAWPVRAVLGPDRAVPVHWYGQQDAGWVAHLDVIRQLGLGRFTRSDDDHFEDWATLARSCGWWWPGEDTCVVVERPARIVPEVVYRDGWRTGFRPQLA